MMRTLYTIVLLGFCLVTIGQAASAPQPSSNRLAYTAVDSHGSHHLSLSESATEIIETDVEVHIPESVDNLFATTQVARTRLQDADRMSGGAIHAPPIYLAVRSLLI